MKDGIIEISTNTILRVIFVALVMVFLYLILDILAILLLAIIIASAVDPVAVFMGRFKIPRLAAVIFIYAVAFLVIGVIVYLVVPTLIGELRELGAVVPKYYDQNIEGVDTTQYGFVLNLQEVVRGIGSQLGDRATSILTLTSSVFGGFINIVSVVIISFYLSVREGEIEKMFRLMSPPEHRDYVVDLWKRVKRKFGRWLQGQLLLGFIVGSLVFIGLSFLGVRYSLSLALVAAVLEIIPMVGPILATIPAVLIASLQSWSLGLGVLILYVVIQQIENNVIVPSVLRKVVGLNPIFVILSLLVGAKLGGALGMFLAVPLAAALGEFVSDFQKSRERLK